MRSALLGCFFFLSLVGRRPGRIAPGVCLRSGHDPRNIWILARAAALRAASPRTRLGAPSCLFLLLFGARAFALALATRHRIAGCHRQSFYRKRVAASE